MPGPANSTARPSPLTSVDLIPPTVFGTTPMPASNATRWEVSTTYFSPLPIVRSNIAPEDETSSLPVPYASSMEMPSADINAFTLTLVVSSTPFSEATYEPAWIINFLLLNSINIMSPGSSGASVTSPPWAGATKKY